MQQLPKDTQILQETGDLYIQRDRFNYFLETV